MTVDDTTPPQEPTVEIGGITFTVTTFLDAIGVSSVKLLQAIKDKAAQYPGVPIPLEAVIDVVDNFLTNDKRYALVTLIGKELLKVIAEGKLEYIYHPTDAV